MIKWPVWLVSTALFAAMVMLPPAAAQEGDGECAFDQGDIEAKQVTDCLGRLERRIEPLESGGARATYIDGKLEDLLARVISLESAVDGVESGLEGLAEQQPTISRGIPFDDDIHLVDTDGLVIAFFTAREGTGDMEARIKGMVNPRVGEESIKPDVLRASDSFIARVGSRDRSATIVMPVFKGEYYELILDIPDPYEIDEEKHIAGVFFVSF